MFRASVCPSSGERLLYLRDTGICHSVCSIQPADQTQTIQSDKYHCRQDTAIFLQMMNTWIQKHIEKRNK